MVVQQQQTTDVQTIPESHHLHIPSTRTATTWTSMASSRYNTILNNYCYNSINYYNTAATTTSTTTTRIRNFLPDFIEHPKPKIIIQKSSFDNNNIPPEDDDDITFFHDFIAGGVAGSVSVIVGHPLDTIKVRMQTSKHVTSSGSGGLLLKSTIFNNEFGGSSISSLYRGMSAPLCTAAIVNAIIFGSYGLSSRIYNNYYSIPIYNELLLYDDSIIPTHDPWKKSIICGSFAGFMQAFIKCPMEHIKCRLQTQCSNKNHHYYTGPFQATKHIIKEYGIQRLFQGFCSTIWREVPSFGIYFASYDYIKDITNVYLTENMNNAKHTKHNQRISSSSNENNELRSSNNNNHSHTWLVSAFSGGCAGCISWTIIYPFDVIKTRIQTSSLTIPLHQLTIYKVGTDLIRQHGYQYLFRGLNVTLIRAFPVNGTIFPIYEFTLKQVRKFYCTDKNAR